MTNTSRSFRLAAIFVVLAMLFVLVGPAAAAVRLPAGQLSYIVQAKDASRAAALVAASGGEVTSLLPVIDGVVARLSSSALARLSAHPAIVQVFPNSQVKLSDNGQGVDYSGIPQTDYPDVVGADEVWTPDDPALAGSTGRGVTVAVVDTGMANMTGLLKGVDGSKRIKAFVDFVDAGSTSLADPNGHGTHVASIIANSDKGKDGEWNGVAPGVNLVGVRVLDANGSGTYEGVLQGIQWVIDHKAQYNIQVMNLSLSAAVQSPYWADPINQAVARAWAAGITVVAAAGNMGPGALSVSVPGNSPYVITVGAFTDNYTPNDWSDDYLAPFSAAGPTYDGFVKPDVVAPGGHITSLMLPSTTLSTQHTANRVDSQYFSMAGTSQATAVVSGVAALVLAQHPGITPDQVKGRLMGTAFLWLNDAGEPLYSMWQQGAGRINAPDAVFAAFEGGEVSANQGLDLQADLAGTTHYEGCTGFDAENNIFFIKDVCKSQMDPAQYGVWAGQYGVWAGQYGVWAGQYGVWAGQYGVWAGQYGVWAGQYGVWAGQYGVWAGQYGVWAGQYGVWAGQYGVWAGQYGVWAGQYGVWAGSTQNWVESGYQAASINSSITASPWVEEP